MIYEYNRVLLQLKNAIKLANSKYTQERGMAVILFDNIIELQIRQQIDNLFMRDRIDWIDHSRKFNSKIRNSTNRYHEKLLKLAKREKIISEADYNLLKIGHEIRNGVYHNGSNDPIKIDFSIQIFFDFINRIFFDWGNAYGFEMIGRMPDDTINFGHEHTKGSRLDNKLYYKNALVHLLSEFESKNTPAVLAQKILKSQIKRASILFSEIQEASKRFNFYYVIWYWNSHLLSRLDNFVIHNRRPKNLNSLLLIYGFLRVHRDELEDIDDIKTRRRLGDKKLAGFKSNNKGKYPHTVDFQLIDKQVKRLTSTSPSIIFQSFYRIEKQLSPLLQDLEEGIQDFEAYESAQRE